MKRCPLKPTALVAVATVALVATADEYQFLVSGYPAANNRHSAASSGTALETATCAAPTSATPLEARFRTVDESDGIALRSDKPLATILYVR